ncbi:hypothetical protein ACIA8R_02280 [Nonomuraea sp. NPDC051191]|uniref:hypothetical protein n=1 Tax=Nonomuraea sp. NPDC051191 TaxID=3364372 RepID=UPI0037895294
MRRLCCPRPTSLVAVPRSELDGWAGVVSADGAGLPPERLADRLRVRRTGFAELGGGLSMNAVPGGGVTVSAVLPATRHI